MVDEDKPYDDDVGGCDCTPALEGGDITTKSPSMVSQSLDMAGEPMCELRGEAVPVDEADEPLRCGVEAPDG
jgi:hypothetical protein